MCHGALGNKNNFATIGRQLHQVTGRSVYSIDLVNHGSARWSDDCSFRQMSVDLQAAIDTLSPRTGSACLTGISMGGRAIMWHALHHASTVSSLIVIDVTPGPAVTEGPYDVDQYLNQMAGVKWPSKDQMAMSKVRKWLDQQFQDVIPDDALRAYVLTNLNRRGESYSWKCNVDALSQSVKELRHLSKIEQRFDKETLFIGGADSLYITEERHDLITDNFPLADIKMLDNCGHWVHHDQPQLFLNNCSDYLQYRK